MEFVQKQKAMISSLGKKGEINQLVKDYGMVIMDECHHAGSQTSEEVLKEVNAQFVYGLTATPKRDDGQEQKIFMQFGPIRFRYTAKDRAAQQGIEHFIYPRFTRLVHTNGDKIYRKLSEGSAQDKLTDAIRGRGAFRRFKSEIYYLGVEQKWFEYRDCEYDRISREWCQEHGITLIEEA
jgi:superfamily II DNA or RNA helicase